MSPAPCPGLAPDGPTFADGFRWHDTPQLCAVCGGPRRMIRCLDDGTHLCSRCKAPEILDQGASR